MRCRQLTGAGMAECAEADAAQQWKLVPNALSPGSVSLQSVADSTMCIMGQGKSGSNCRSSSSLLSFFSGCLSVCGSLSLSLSRVVFSQQSWHR